MFKDRLDLLHPVFVPLCNNLEKIEDVYMPSICAALTDYCKKYIQRAHMSESEMNDLALLRKKATELISCAENYCAIASLASLLFHLLEPKDFGLLERPILRLLSGPEHYRQIALNMMRAVLERNSSVFAGSIKYLRICMTDTEYCKHKKAEAMQMLANESNIKWIQRELEYWIRYYFPS